MAEIPSVWYGCSVCGELRRYPFEINGSRPGCRCAPTNGASGPAQADRASTRDEERRVLELAKPRLEALR
jgi:hypothetical protein